ncbi:hypothetical protein N9B73_01270 [Verrucomicrobiales bacterium]|nr:hypothetical protein [Verrucomicrobiales bacterium]|tara:strand:- start:107 stop:388 length:282 start_codon:yes stop_codon:yes gene_type:complete
MNAADFKCPQCDAGVSPNAQGCHACGARKGEGRWLRSEIYDGIGVDGDDDFDYDEFIETEFGSGQRRKTTKEKFWWAVAVLMLLVFVGFVTGC